MRPAPAAPRAPACLPQVRLWDASSGECAVALKGHKSAVSCLCYSDSGSLLASGSNDTDVIMWDVAGEAGLYRLRGHKDQVTAVAFGPTPAAAVASTSAAAAAGPAKLVTSSKDGYVKVWDLETQHCVQTVTGHRGEVWALALDPSGRRLVTGSNDQELRVFAVGAPPAGASNGGDHHQANGGGADAAAAAAAVAGTSGGSSSSKQYLFPMGSVRRSNGDRVLSLAFDGSGQLLGCQAAGKRLEVSLEVTLLLLCCTVSACVGGVHAWVNGRKTRQARRVGKISDQVLHLL